MKISDSTAISMPMRNLLSILAAVGVGVWAYFGVIERLNKLETVTQLAEKDLSQAEERLGGDIEKNNEFRIKWPRGELGSPPADSEQFMLIEHIAGQVEKIQNRMEDMMNNGVNITRLQKDVDALRADVEKLKDGQRTLKHQNGNSLNYQIKINSYNEKVFINNFSCTIPIYANNGVRI